MTDENHLPAKLEPGALLPASPDPIGASAMIADAGDASRLALHRFLHRQHPQPEHAPRLCPRMRHVLCLVRRARPDACDRAAVRRCELRGGPPADAQRPGP